VLALPVAYQADALADGLLADLMILAPTFLVLGALIIGGRQVLLTMSRQDPLTGLVNRRAFEHRLDSSIDGRGPSATFGLMLCDLNSFKSVNDRHGHPQGDRVLRETARVLKATVRATDEVARLGGDEFAIVIDGADERIMTEVAYRVRAELRVAGEALGLGENYKLEASLGWAIFPSEASNTESLVAMADLALRQQKLVNDGSWPRRGRVPANALRGT
jgi:diguanylate cyclase (GGDEF)-like protein